MKRIKKISLTISHLNENEDIVLIDKNNKEYILEKNINSPIYCNLFSSLGKKCSLSFGVLCSIHESNSFQIKEVSIDSLQEN